MGSQLESTDPQSQSIMLVFPLLLLLSGLSQSQAQHCDSAQLDSLGEEVTDCVLRHQTNFQDTQDTFHEEIYIQEAACGTVKDIMEECGGMWGSCYTDTEVKQLQSMQLDTLKETMGDFLDLSSCSLEAEPPMEEQEAYEEDEPAEDETVEDEPVEEESDLEISEIPEDECTDDLCIENEEAVEIVRRSGLLGRLLSVFSNGRR